MSGNLKKAEEALGAAKTLRKRRHSLIDSPREATKILDRVRDFIRLQEHNQLVQRISSASRTEPAVAKETGVAPRPNNFPQLQSVSAGAKVPQSPRAAEAKKAPAPPQMSEPEPPPASPALPPLQSYGVPMRFVPVDPEAMSAMLKTPGTLKECQLRVQYACLDVQRGFDELLCLNEIHGIERYWYQIETAKKVLKYFHGRVLLCDEVGLGKTVEAGMLMKEYLLRGMVKRILILTPAPLVSQWQEEMGQKFNIRFATTEDSLLNGDPDRFWRAPFIIASIHTAKSSRNCDPRRRKPWIVLSIWQRGSARAPEKKPCSRFSPRIRTKKRLSLRSISRP